VFFTFAVIRQRLKLFKILKAFKVGGLRGEKPAANRALRFVRGKQAQ
jgi:hypothetical protein